MSSVDRQNKLLISEDWKRIYQSFKNAEFKSYDFDNLRRVMISYLKENYPEDFNDYIESSEYIALIDLIAFLGQNLAFRIDLNARENFLDLAERKESILRLARLLAYNPKRNLCANGLLKIVGISTTEDIISSNNINLQNQTILWNDSVNAEWHEHFTRILNAALPTNSTVGNPIKTANINGIPTKLYCFNGKNASGGIFSYKKNIKGTTATFEVVPANIEDNNIYEDTPFPGKNLSFLHREDGYGPSSSNTGYFCMFKQGTLNNGTFNIENPSTNQQVAINTTNINNTDVWLYSLDSENNEDKLWTRVDSIDGNNIIYNNISTDTKNIYSVITKENDTINLMFSDGNFGQLPQGHFKVYYRVSKNQNIIIYPSSMRGVNISVPYLSKKGTRETVTLTLSLKYTVDNASTSESNKSIKRNAPATYYTQNRLVTGEDYQLGADSISQDIIKTKTINRLSSGISRYHDLLDPTGKYSNTILFGDDGIIYKRYKNIIEKFKFQNISDIEGTLYNLIEPLLSSTDLTNFYFDKFPRFSLKHIGITWNNTNKQTGFFVSNTGHPLSVDNNNLKYIKFNTLVKFIPPDGHVFVGNNIVPFTPGIENATYYKWAKIINIKNKGIFENNTEGYVLLNEDIPSNCYISELITPLPNRLSTDAIYQIINQISSYRTFGLRYSRDNNEWRIIEQNNLDSNYTFSINYQGDTSNQQKDNSWFILFKTVGGEYTIKYRTLDYIFESERQIKFYYDQASKQYEKTSKKDSITVLSINKRPDSMETLGLDHMWQINKEYRDLSSYINGKKIILALNDNDQDGVIDDPDIFKTIVNENNDNNEKLIFLKSKEINGHTNDYEYIPKDEIDIEIVNSKNELRDLAKHPNNKLFYFIKENTFERLQKETLRLVTDPNYLAYYGRDNLKFKYIHYVNNDSRIDPGVSNIMDTYILTSNYDTEFRRWLAGEISTKPLPPSSDALYTNYGKKIYSIKSISDDVIYHPVKYRVLFGANANITEKAKFKIVKNKDIFVNDNELKSNTINAINKYFSIERWDFGESFYFSEMSAFIIQELSPMIRSFIIVPLQEDLHFGALFEINCNYDEIFISDATVDDIEIIDEITASNIRSKGSIYQDSHESFNTVTSSY